jgi:hypothetical protein
MEERTEREHLGPFVVLLLFLCITWEWKLIESLVLLCLQSTGMNVNRAVVKASDLTAGGETYEDIVQYYKYQADRGDHAYAFRLGRIHYTGSLLYVIARFFR